MTAFVVAQVNIKIPEKFQEYAQHAAESMKPFGGELVVRGKKTKHLAGETHFENTAVISFPDEASINGWYESESYQKIIPLRNEAAEITITSFNVPA